VVGHLDSCFLKYYVFFGTTTALTKSKSWTTTEELKMTESLDEIHPGEILLEDFMKPMGITARQLAADIDVSPSRISDLVNGNRPVTADTALRLGLFFSMEPRFWLNLQTEYDMRQATRTLTAAIAPRIRVFQQPAAA
jgi:addiction module HigA family antidote